jgi:hypothetical protein
MGKSDRIHTEQLESSLPGDLILDYQAVSDWVREVFREHCDRVVVRVIDAASVEGFYKTLRYGTRRYPAVIVNGRQRFIGSRELPLAGREIALQLSQRPVQT